MKNMKKLVISFTTASVLALGITGGLNPAYADSAPGDVIVSLGENLSADQKTKLLSEMNVPSNALTVSVSNKEEQEYLGSYIPKSQIGTRSLSSAKITLGEKGTGIKVTTNHINWVTNEMYTNALATAGVADAEVYVTAPFDVSGTAGLTGIIKAYETSTGEKIPEEQKQVANQEMVTTAKLGDDIGKDEANALMTAVKEDIAKDMPKTDAEMQQVVEDNAKELNIDLTDQQKADVSSVFNKMKDLDINWHEVGDQMSAAKEKLEKFINSDEAQGFFAKVGDFAKNVFNAIVDFFKGVFDGSKDSKTETPAETTTTTENQ